jgi:hypothetical protein
MWDRRAGIGDDDGEEGAAGDGVLLQSKDGGLPNASLAHQTACKFLLQNTIGGLLFPLFSPSDATTLNHCHE